MKLGITDVPGNGVEHSANSLRDGELKTPQAQAETEFTVLPKYKQQYEQAHCHGCHSHTGADKNDLNAESHQLLISKVFQLSATMDQQLCTERHLTITE